MPPWRLGEKQGTGVSSIDCSNTEDANWELLQVRTRVHSLLGVGGAGAYCFWGGDAMNQTQEERSALPQLQCLGLAIGGHSLPPFQIEAGGAVCLHMEYSPDSVPYYDSVYPLLLGRTRHPAIRVHGVVAGLDRPFPPRRWQFWRRHLSARDWLLRVRGLSPAESARVLSVIPAIPPEMRVGWLGWNERTMLALEACLLRPPDLLVFDMAGCALPTKEAVFDRLATRPSQLAVAYLKTNPDADSPCLPGATCYVIAAQSSQPATVE